MKNSKTLLVSLMILLLAVSMVLVSCNADSSSSPRKTNDEDVALVTDVVQDVAVPEDESTEIDYSKTFDPYVDDFVNGLFGGEGTKVELDDSGDDYVIFKFTKESYKYDGGIAKVFSMPITFELKNVTIESGDFKGKVVSGTINYDEDPSKITGTLTCDGSDYTDVLEFFNEGFGVDVLPRCVNAFLENGVKIDDDKLTIEAKGSVKYDEDDTLQSITLDEFSLKTKEDIQIQKNKYSLEVAGNATLGFTADPDGEEDDDVELSSIEISKATMKLGVTNDSGNHTIEITTSFKYPGELVGVKIPFEFHLSEVKIDDQQIDNWSMTTLLIKSLADLF